MGYGNILVIDDDEDDLEIFVAAVNEISKSAVCEPISEATVALSDLRTGKISPDVVFLDLNMPRKNGFECLVEIKQNPLLKALPVIIFSTSFDQEIVDRLHVFGARYYIRKPSEYSQIKKVIYQSLILVSQDKIPESARDNFVLTGDLKLKHS